jgi:hypothetical protein
VARVVLVQVVRAGQEAAGVGAVVVLETAEGKRYVHCQWRPPMHAAQARPMVLLRPISISRG